MNRRERLEAAIAHKDVDRIPASVWMHFSAYDQDPRSLAEHQVAFNDKYDYDYIKLMPFGLYSVQDYGPRIKIEVDPQKTAVVEKPAFETIEGYKNIRPLEGRHGTHGQTVQIAEHVKRLVGDKTPFMQTVFSPLSTLKKMAPGSLLDDMKEYPEAIHSALEAITETTINFVTENIKTGVDGFFFATQMSTYDVLDDAMHQEFVQDYDLKVIDAYKDQTWLNTAHIHGSNIMFKTFSDNYPLPILNWHDRDTEPSFAEARKISDKTFMGGIAEFPAIQASGSLAHDGFLNDNSAEEIEKHIHQAIDMAEGKGIIIGPGCVASPDTAEDKLHAVRKACDSWHQ